MMDPHGYKHKMYAYKKEVQMPDVGRVFIEMAELFQQKNAGYGNSYRMCKEQLNIRPEMGLAVRMSDKWNRFCSLVRSNMDSPSQIRDTLIDLAVYAAMAVAELDEVRDIQKEVINDQNTFVVI